MENRSFFIEATLMRVESIFDITPEIISQLQSLPGKKIDIRRFAISPIDMQKWFEENGFHKGVEYDIADNSISIKVEEDPIRKAIRMAFQEEFFPVVIDKLSQHLPDETFSTSYNDPHALYGEFSGDLVCSDGQLDQKGSPSPRIVVLIGPKSEIVHGANKWIRGGNNMTKFVIGVEVSERPPIGWCPWGLKRVEIAEMDLEDLTNVILDHHEDNNLPIVGVIGMKVFVFTKNEVGIPESDLIPSWTCMFGPVESYEDTLGRLAPSGITSRLTPGMSSITLPKDMGEVELPFDAIKEKVEEAIEEEKQDRALVMATEAQNWANMTRNSAPLILPYPA